MIITMTSSSSDIAPTYDSMLNAELIKSRFNEKLASMSGIEEFPRIPLDNRHEMGCKKREMQILKKSKGNWKIFFEKSHKILVNFEHEIINLQTFRYSEEFCVGKCVRKKGF